MPANPSAIADDPRTFYDAYGEREWDRLDESIDGRLEFVTTIETIEEYLPSSGRILDAGGGAGRYSIWFATQGYDVTMIDLSRGQLSVARNRIREHGVESAVTLSQATITDLGLAANTFEMTCCLGGPLSHVLYCWTKRFTHRSHSRSRRRWRQASRRDRVFTDFCPTV